MDGKEGASERRQLRFETRAIHVGQPGEIYHFSTSCFPTIREVVETICERMNVQFGAVTEIASDRPGKDAAYLMDSEKSRVSLGWEPLCTLSEGVDRTIAWIDQGMETISRLPWEYIHKE